MPRMHCRQDRCFAAPGDLPPRRVFLSHTSERRATDAERAFIVAARSAVIRAGDAVIDMSFFTAQSSDPAEYCVRMLAAADVYAGIIGARYGSPVRNRPELSYTELEFETATARGLPRLVFLLPENPGGLDGGQSAELEARQAAFRRRLQDVGLTTARVASPAELETRVYQALVELPPAPTGAPGPDWWRRRPAPGRVRAGTVRRGGPAR